MHAERLESSLDLGEEMKKGWWRVVARDGARRRRQLRGLGKRGGGK
jgi:hypothetical protein